MNATAFAPLDTAAITEIFAPVLDRNEWQIVGNTVETPDEAESFGNQFNLVSFLLDNMEDEDEGDIRLALDRELEIVGEESDPRLAVTGAASVEDYAPDA